MNWLIVGGIVLSVCVLFAGIFIHLIGKMGDWCDRITFRG